jgi:uroporphyrinogen decarboxylase
MDSFICCAANVILVQLCLLDSSSVFQVIQVFDSWASHLSPQDFEVFAAPYTTQIIADFRKTHPHVPTILYISGSGGILERMAACKPDCLSIDGSVDLADAIKRCGTEFAYQGNIDPGCVPSLPFQLNL